MVHVEMQTMQNGRTGIRTELFQIVAARHWNSIKDFIIHRQASFSDISQPNTVAPRFTILHYACNLEDWKEATAAVQTIFEILDSFDPKPDKNDLKRFLNVRDADSNTAFQLAIGKGHDDIIKILLTRKADVSMEVCQELLLKNTKYRSVLLQMLDQGVYLERDQFDPLNQELWSVYCNFKQITGESNPQTKGLSTILYLGGAQRYKFMMSPLVQMFIDAKCAKYQYWIWFSMSFHILWYLLLAFFLVGITPNESAESASNSTAYNVTLTNLTTSTITTAKLSAILTAIKVDQNNSSDISGIVSSIWYKIILCIVGIIAVIKEIREFCSCPSKRFYINQTENWGQWGIFVIGVIAVILSFVGRLPNWANVIASTIYSVGIVVSLLLIQGQFSKTHLFGVNNQMMMKSLKKLVKFLGTFVVLIFAFAVILCTLLPHTSWNTIVVGFTTIFSKVTGELNMNDVFTEESVEDPSFVIKAFFVYTLFIIVIVILFQNLWIGKTVSDIEELKNLGIAAHYASRLEVVNIFESFFLLFSEGYLDRYSVLMEQRIKNEERPSGIVADFKYGIKFKKLPFRTRKLIYKNVNLFPNGIEENDYEYF